MNVDYLIVGQGISGSFLSRDLLKAGKTLVVIDDNKPFTASKVASGVINPITGRRLVRTWEIEKLMPFAVNAYTAWGEEEKLSLILPCNILDFHPTPQMVLAFEERRTEEKEYLRIPENPDRWKSVFNYDFSIGEINPCWLINLQALLSNWRLHLMQNQLLLQETFNREECIITKELVTYRNINAQKIIFCDGVCGFENPYFNRLPYARNKGQALLVNIPDLPAHHIYKQGITIVPWKDGLFWVGSSYEWEFLDLRPTTDFRLKIEKQLKHWLKLGYEVVDHLAAERPANMERRPFIGLHPLTHSVGLFNGMGTKGCSLVPYFSAEFASHLVNQTPLQPEVDVRRFSKILSRNP